MRGEANYRAAGRAQDPGSEEIAAVVLSIKERIFDLY